MKNIFLDSNIWLSVYTFSSDDLNQFMKLSDLIGTDVNILLPEQVRNEVWRNRENKIKEAMSKFENWKLEIPNIVKGYSQYKDFQKSVNDLLRFHRDFVQQINKDIISNNLHADHAISGLFEKCTKLTRTPEIVKASVLRYEMGNPPGKDRKYGDAINWLSLLSHVSKGEDLFFIGADSDFQSVLDKNRFNQFLLDEWKMQKNSELFFFKSLTEFFNTHLQAIQLKNELIADRQKDTLINLLENSGSYAQTHHIVGQLSVFKTWTDNQIRRILDAVENNSQVGAVSSDYDVEEFLNSLPAPTHEKCDAQPK